MANKEQFEHVVGSAADEPVGAEQDTAQTANGEPEQRTDVTALQAELEAARARADDYWNKLVRTQAEMENLRKRSARELEQAHRYAVERFATELLAVKDSLEMGVDAASNEIESEKLREGTELTLRMLVRAMEKFNIVEINPQDQPFDPARHQAMTTQENSQLPPNTVVAVLQKGYAIGERLLRPAMVIVSKGPA
ncbi:MAG TPA: nucleotide exchange factor GrpE [Gammaproteobacteria bacterium]|nr:nucleotide exchange factor GrpE [Gammaproteobacteria bacterium]